MELVMLAQAGRTAAATLWPLAAALSAPIIGALSIVLEAFAEARRMAREAHRRHPFLD
jgi:hypothetical protein